MLVPRGDADFVGSGLQRERRHGFVAELPGRARRQRRRHPLPLPIDVLVAVAKRAREDLDWFQQRVGGSRCSRGDCLTGSNARGHEDDGRPVRSAERRSADIHRQTPVREQASGKSFQRNG